MKTRYIPRAILVIAAIHVALGLLDSRFRDLAGAGLLNAVGGREGREAAFWFLATGLALAALGESARWAVRETGRLPAGLGGWLFGLGVLAIVCFPLSGGWALAAVGLVALRHGRQAVGVPSTRPAAATPAVAFRRP